MHRLAVGEMTGRLREDDVDRMRDANRRFAEAVDSGDVGAALDADEELHRIPVTALGNEALEAVLDQFDPLVRRAERLRFSADGHASVELHERLIELSRTETSAGGICGVRYLAQPAGRGCADG